MVNVKCQRCKHEWDYSGSKIYAKCPNCYTTVKIRSFDEELDVKPRSSKGKGVDDNEGVL